MANVLILNGSPTLDGNVVAMLDSFKRGLEKNNNKIIQYNIAYMNVHDSIGVGSETINDDMNQIVLSLKEAEYVVFASPLYFYSFSGYLKNVIDRLAGIEDIENKKLIVLVAMASDNQMSLKPLQEQSKLIADHLAWQLIDFQFLSACEGSKDYLAHLNELEKQFQLGLSIK